MEKKGGPNWPQSTKIDTEQTFLNLYNAHYEELLFTAYCRLRNKKAAEDVTQNLFIYIWKNRHKITITGSPKAYLVVSIRNLCKNYIIKEMRDKSRNEGYSQNSDQVTYIHLEEDDEQLRTIKILLERQPKLKRDIFDRMFIKEDRHQEIADDLGLSVNTVRKYGYNLAKYIKSKLKGNKFPFFCITFCFLFCLNIILWKI